MSPTYGVLQPLRILWCIRHKQFLKMLAVFYMNVFLIPLQERISLSLLNPSCLISLSPPTLSLFLSLSFIFFVLFLLPFLFFSPFFPHCVLYRLFALSIYLRFGFNKFSFLAFWFCVQFENDIYIH